MTKPLLQVALAVAVLATPALADQWNKRFAVSGRPELRVETNDGAVSIRAWDGKEIEARVTTEGWRIKPGEVEITERQNGDRVELEVRVSHHVLEFNFGRRLVRLELQVPREIRSEIRTGDGSILVQGLHGETRLYTGDGRIEAQSLDGTLDAKTGDGRVVVQGRFDGLVLRTGDGSVEVEVGPGSKMNSQWSIRTGDGHVRLRLPSDFSAELDVHTGDGHIQSDLPVTSTGRSDSGRELRGKLNSGGPPLVIRTNDGSITLAKL
jgi:hypothetical protein